jgi:hypothetical protein
MDCRLALVASNYFLELYMFLQVTCLVPIIILLVNSIRFSGLYELMWLRQLIISCLNINHILDCMCFQMILWVAGVPLIVRMYLYCVHSEVLL